MACYNYFTFSVEPLIGFVLPNSSPDKKNGIPVSKNNCCSQTIHCQKFFFICLWIKDSFLSQSQIIIIEHNLQNQLDLLPMLGFSIFICIIIYFRMFYSTRYTEFDVIFHTNPTINKTRLFRIEYMSFYCITNII